MSKPSDINIKLIKLSEDRKKGDENLSTEINIEKEQRSENDNIILTKIEVEKTKRNDSHLKLEEKLNKLSERKTTDRNLLLKKLESLESKILDLTTIEKPKIDLPELKRRLCDCKDGEKIVDFNHLPPGIDWYATTLGDNPFKIESTTGEHIVYTMEEPHGASFSASSMVITTKDDCMNHMDSSTKLQVFNCTLNIYDRPVYLFRIKCLCFDYCQLNGQATIFLNGLPINGGLMSDLDGTSVGGCQITVRADTFNREKLQETGKVEIKGKDCDSIKKVSVWIANYFFIDNIKYCLCEEKEPPKRDECKCEEGDTRYTTGINDPTLTIPSSHLPGDKFDVRDDNYLSNKFIFHFGIEKSPIIGGAVMPSNNIIISPTDCGRPVIMKLSSFHKWAPTGHMTLDGKLLAGGHPQLYGLESEYLDINANNSYVYSLLTMVSHLQDGKISKGQNRWIYERAIMSAVPRHIIEKYMAFDHAKANITNYLNGSGGDSIARVLTYDIIQMITFGDIYDNKIRLLVNYEQIFQNAAEELNVPSKVLTEIKRLVNHEKSLYEMKKQVFWGDTPYVPPKPIDTTPEKKWHPTGHMTLDGKLVSGGHPQLYALDVDWLDIDANSNYVYSLLTMVSLVQDGKILAGQRKWVYERSIMSAVPLDIIEKYINFDHQNARLEDYLTGSGGDSIARVLLYDVIQMIIFGDLYDKKVIEVNEYNNIFQKAATRLKISDSLLKQIRNIVDNELSLYKNKKNIFWKDTPYIPPTEETKLKPVFISSSVKTPELHVNNSTLVLYNYLDYPEFYTKKPTCGLKKICFKYCELGGANALIIDGNKFECRDFSLLDGTSIGSNLITVNETIISGTKYDKKGEIIISNKNCIKNVSIYGQELYIDNIEYCIGECERPVKKDVVGTSTNEVSVGGVNYKFTMEKIDNGVDTTVLYYDENGKSVSQQEYQSKIDSRNREIYKYGNIHPTLGKEMETMSDTDIVNVKVWKSNGQNNRNLEKKVEYTELYENFLRKKRHLNLPNNDNYSEITKEFLNSKLGKELHSQMIGQDIQMDISSKKLNKREIMTMSKEANVVGLFLQDDSFNLDIEDQKDDTNATTIVDVEGWRGTNLRACVFEGSPGNDDGRTGFVHVNNNVDADGQRSGIQEAYKPNIFPGTSDHATSVTAIITNRAANVAERGYAPDSLIYSANDYSLHALKWAVKDRHCRVVNQSFHRDYEWDSPIPVEDDLYKDFLALNHPYPFITTASGNWSTNSTSEPGGPDGSLEFVNHKSYNCVTVGNANDFWGSNPNGMVSSSVWQNPNSDHGDWELPEICANGNSVRFNGQGRGGGTSYASPAVAGTALLLQNADNILLEWPEGIRAILFAGAIQNVKDDTWFSDVINNVDGYDGCGCIDTEESMRITIRSFSSGKRQPNNNPKPRGWDIGTLSDSDFEGDENYVSYFIGVPNVDPTGNGSKTARIKVALAWSSEITMFFGFPIQSKLNHDFDIYLHNEAGVRVAHSTSWDNPYEVIDFTGNRGEIYEIRIRRYSGTGKAWYGIAWTSGDGMFWRLIREPIGNLLKQHAVSELIGNQQPSIEYNIVPEIGNLNLEKLWVNTMQNSKYIIDYNNIFKLATQDITNVSLKLDRNKLENCISKSRNEILLMKLNVDKLNWEPVKITRNSDKLEFYLEKSGIFTFAIDDSTFETDKKGDGFFIRKGDNYNLVKTDIKFNVVPITKNLPPSIIQLEYNNCKVKYQLTEPTEVGFRYQGNTYVPQDKYLLRYSSSGIVTQDFRPCRVTIVGEDNYLLSIENSV